MASIVRIKRRADEEPLDAIVVNFKRAKTNANDDTKENTLLQFVGTLSDKSDDILTHIKHNTKQHLEQQYKKHFDNITDKIKEERDSALKQSRFKLINTFRSKGLVAEGSSTDNEINYTVLEVDATDTEDIELETVVDNVQYIYDVYYTNSDDFADDTIDYQDIDIHPLNFELVNEQFRVNGGNNIQDEESDDSEDSNAENNWRNDYPDEMDDDNSITEKDMIDAAQRLTLEDDLSSDDGEEGFVYSIDDPDVLRSGQLYARFKAFHKKKTTDDDSEEDSDNPKPNRYDEDSDDDDPSHYYDE